MISYKIKFKIALLLSIFFVQQISACCFGEYTLISQENGSVVRIFLNAHETDEIIAQNTTQADITRQLGAFQNILDRDPSAILYFENIHPIFATTALLPQIPTIIRCRNMVYSDKRTETFIQNIILILIESLELGRDLEFKEENSLKNLITKFKINNVRELKNQILSSIKIHDQNIAQLINELERIEEELKTIINLDFSKLLQKMYSIKKVKDMRQKNNLIHFLKILNTINLEQADVDYSYDKLDKMDKFIIESVEKNKSNSIVIVGATHAFKIAKYLQQNPKYRLVQNTFPDFNPTIANPLEILARRLTPEQIISR